MNPETPATQLRCSTCGASPTPDQAKYSARLGGTHFKTVTHGAGIPGRATTKARTCGTWIEVPPEERR